jgi:hypothetical protein
MLKIRDDIGKFEENIHIPQDVYAINSYTLQYNICFQIFY